VLKKNIILFFSVLTFFTSDNSFAQKRVSTARRKSNVNTNTPNKKPKEEPSSNTAIESLTCEEKYNLCMDNACVNKAGIRTDCDTSIDSFQTVVRDGEEFRIGNDLYTFARGICEETLKSCELKERNHIETVYKAKIKEDTLTKNYLDAISAGSDETQQLAFQEYLECMGGVCGNMFADCFTIKNIERRAVSCEKVLSKTAKPLTVKGMFYKKMEEARNNLCANSGGYVDNFSKVCNIEVTYGTPEILQTKDGEEHLSGKIDKAVAKKSFKIGEIVECTQEYFSTQNFKKQDLGRTWIDFVGGGVKIVSGVALAVAGAIGTVASVGIASVETAPMMANGGALILKGSASIINGSIKANYKERENSACFINGNYVVPMGQYFKVNFVN